MSALRHCTGCCTDDGTVEFVETWNHLRVEAVQDGVMTHFNGDPRRVQPVLRVKGRYRDFALLETPILGALARGSRTATNDN